MDVLRWDDETDELVDLQALIDSGAAWTSEGSVGRAAEAAIEAGYCVLGPVGTRTWTGRYIPSRFEVVPGTVGSEEYAERMAGERDA